MATYGRRNRNILPSSFTAIEGPSSLGSQIYAPLQGGESWLQSPSQAADVSTTVNDNTDDLASRILSDQTTIENQTSQNYLAQDAYEHNCTEAPTHRRYRENWRLKESSSIVPEGDDGDGSNYRPLPNTREPELAIDKGEGLPPPIPRKSSKRTLKRHNKINQDNSEPSSSVESDELATSPPLQTPAWTSFQGPQKGSKFRQRVYMLAANTPGPTSLQNLILGDSPATTSDTTAISAPVAACLSYPKQNQPAGVNGQILQMLAFNASLKTASLHGVNHTRPEVRSSKYPGKNSNIFSKVKKAVSSRLPGFIVKGQFKDDQHLDSSSTQYQCRDENQDVYVMDIDKRIAEGENLSSVTGKAKGVMDNGFITRKEIVDEGQSVRSRKSLSDIRSLRSRQSSHEPQDSDESYTSSTESPQGGMCSGAYRRYGVGGPTIPPLPGSVQYLEEEYQTRAYNQRPFDAGNNDSFISSSPDAQSTPTRSRLEPIERDGRRELTRVPTGSPSFLDPRSSRINHLSDIEVDRPFRHLKLSGHPKHHPKRKSSKEIEGNPFVGETEMDGHRQKKQYRTLYTDKQKTNLALKRYETDLEMVFPDNPLTTKDKNQKRKARVFDNKYFDPSKLASKATGKKIRDDRGTRLQVQDESSAMDIDELQMDYTALMN